MTKHDKNYLPAKRDQPTQPETANSPDIAKALELAHLLSDSGFSRQPVAALAILMLTGVELGWGPLESVNRYHVVDGKPTLKANTLVAMCQASPECIYFQEIDHTPTSSTWETHRRNYPKPQRQTFTMDDAKRASLTDRGVWRKHPGAMMAARASSALARKAYADIVRSTYTPDEQREIAGEYEQPELRPEQTPLRVVEAPVETLAERAARECPSLVFRVGNAFGEVTKGHVVDAVKARGLVPNVEQIMYHLLDGYPVPGAKRHHLRAGLNNILPFFGMDPVDELPNEPLTKEKAAAMFRAREDAWLALMPATLDPEEAGKLAVARLVTGGVCENALVARRLLFKRMNAVGWVKGGDNATLQLVCAGAHIELAHELKPEQRPEQGEQS